MSNIYLKAWKLLLERLEQKTGWVKEIVKACDKAGIPVFEKNNLKPLLIGEWAGWKLRQEFPEVKCEQK